MEKVYTFLISVLSRSFNTTGETKEYGWYLTGPTLAYFICNYTLNGVMDFHVTVRGSLDKFLNSMLTYNCSQISPTVWEFPAGGRIVLHRTAEPLDVVCEFPKDYDRMMLQFPRQIGTALDAFNQAWSEITHRNQFAYPENCFFTAPRRQNAIEFIGKMLECGDRAGIKDKMFIGFGGALGYALIHGLLPNDDDIDMCILADDIPQEQRHQYLMECKKAGLCENRMHGPVTIDGKYCWFSIGPKSPYTENGVKSCNWFWFKHSGYWWHSKGAKWIGRRELSKDYITAKGIPDVTAFDGTLKKVMFHGIDVQVPDPLGVCLDAWYPGWVSRKKDSSAVTTILSIPNEKDKRTWFITKK